MNYKILILLALIGAIIVPTASAATLTIYGLPAGSSFIWRAAPNYTTITTPITGYTTQIPIYISPSTNSTYHGNVPWQYQGSGTTVTYNGVVYTMLTSQGSTCATQLIASNGINFCAFYVYLNESLWNSNESAELKASNTSLQTANIVIKSIQNQSTTAYYNGTIAAGQVSHSASDVNGSITFTTTQIAKQTSYICINLSSSLFSDNLCNPGNYHIPVAVINGHFGINGPTSVTVTAKLSSSLHGSQTVPYTVSIKSNGATLYSASTTQSGFSNTQTFTYTVGQSLNITFDGGGNANYTPEDPSIVSPPNINFASQLRIDNLQSSSMVSNTQIPISTSSNIIMFQTYANTVCQNVEFFNGITGAVLNSWLEGNTVNEQQTANLCQQSDTQWWLQLPDNVPATSNDLNIYIGFAANTINLLTNSIGAGESPILSSTYAAYDNGNYVFPTFYQAWGNSILQGGLPAGWAASTTSPTLVHNANSLSITGAGSNNECIGSTSTDQPTLPFILDTYEEMEGVTTTAYSVFGVSTAPSAACSTEYYTIDTYGAGSDYAIVAGAGTRAASSSSLTTTPQVYTGNYPVAGTMGSLYVNYGGIAATATTGGSLFTGKYISFYVFGTSATQVVYWSRARIPPPNNVQPIVTSGPIQNLQAVSITITPSSGVYPVSANAMASCIPTSDTCTIQSPLGTTLATGTGNVVLPIAFNAVGTHTYYANDITDGLTASNTLTISQNASVETLIQSCSSSSSCTVTGTIATYGNQITANLYNNNQFVASTNTMITNTIANSVGSYTYTFNNIGSVNYTSNTLTTLVSLYVPIYFTNTIGTNTITGAFSTTSYYPYELYTSAPIAGITYNLIATANGVTISLSNLANILFTPPSNALAATNGILTYSYTLNEIEAGVNAPPASLTATISTNMIDAPTGFTFNAYSNNCIQYLPCLATLPFNPAPATWSIQSDLNQHSNTIAGEIFSNANVSFYPQITLTYNQFLPSISFLLNLSNNRQIGQINQYPFNVIAANAVPAAPNTRLLINTNSYIMRTLGPLITNTSFSSIFTLNNYTFTPTPTVFVGNVFSIYSTYSTFQNPNINISAITFFSSNSGYISPTENNECPVLITGSPSSVPTFGLYLADNNANSTIYEFDIFNGSSYLHAGYYMQIWQGGVTNTKVQQVYVTGSGAFDEALIGLRTYQFKLSRPCTTQFYSTNFTTWANPIKIYISSNSIQPTVPLPNLIVNCSKVASNSIQDVANILCTGNDNTSLTTGWSVTIYNVSPISGWVAINTLTASGNVFSIPFNGYSNTMALRVIVIATGNGFSIPQTFDFNQGISFSGLTLIDRGFLMLLFLLVGLGLDAGGQTTGAISDRHIISSAMFIEAVMVALTWLLGISIFNGPAATIVIDIFLIGIGVIMYRQEVTSFG